MNCDEPELSLIEKTIGNIVPVWEQGQEDRQGPHGLGQGLRQEDSQRSIFLAVASSSAALPSHHPHLWPSSYIFSTLKLNVLEIKGQLKNETAQGKGIACISAQCKVKTNLEIAGSGFNFFRLGGTKATLSSVSEIRHSSRPASLLHSVLLHY